MNKLSLNVLTHFCNIYINVIFAVWEKYTFMLLVFDFPGFAVSPVTKHILYKTSNVFCRFIEQTRFMKICNV